ncbi:hypothetical protein Tco_0518939 [Tanacetum coccineum]
MVPPNNLGPDLNGKSINETRYRGMIRSLMYLAASGPDIQFSTCLYARYQANLKVPKRKNLFTLDRPDKPKPFLTLLIKLSLPLNEITFTTNNEVALIYPSHPNQEYFMAVSDFISKCCLKEAFTRAPNQYKEYLSEFWYTTKVLPGLLRFGISTPYRDYVREKIGITIFRNALRAQYLPHSSMYVPPPSITTVRPWFATIGYNREIGAKGTIKKSCLPPRWRLLMGQIIQCLGGKTGGLNQISNKDATILYCLANGVQAIYNLDVPVDSKAPRYSSPTEEVPQGKNPRARSGLRRNQSSKHTFESTTEASKNPQSRLFQTRKN